MKTDALAQLAGLSVVSATGFYVAFRWLLSPLAERLPNGVGLFIDTVGVVLLLPEYACTTILRRFNGHPPQFAFLYGEVVSSVACTLHEFGLVVTEAMHVASIEVEHKQALIGAVIGAVCVVILA